ncbi:hypothetical protein [Myxococcus sp. AB025B]|uniref:hypothetical protein n=1 Tax=Myxococcus sp. AB025B TaxID=2562794 RepID=UPI001144A519|nr:hypothetical protein [Myxococcus sp. AB025B]
MLNPVHVDAWRAAIVGNARLEGRPVRALMLEDPWAGCFVRSPETFLGFEVDGGFEPSFDRWFDRTKERELLAATREYVAFVGPQAREDHSGDVFYAAMGQKALELLTDTEASFQTRLATPREADVKEYRRRSKDWWPVQPAARGRRGRWR